MQYAIVHHIKDWNHMIILIDAEKVFKKYDTLHDRNTYQTNNKKKVFQHNEDTI